jgi:predicted hydrocarbon binding protein
MSLRTANVPEPFVPPFEKAEEYVSRLFEDFKRQPEKGTLHISGDRYVLVRCQSLYVAWFDAMAETFGEQTAREFIYNTAREIGRSDSAEFSKRLGVTDGVERLASGPVHFAHAGWAFVDILPDSAPAMDDTYYLHYYHPNTFESEVLASLGRKVERCACLFSAGYSAGWCSDAFGVEVHGREIRCTARGDDNCEFIMAPVAQLDAHEKRIT